MNIGKVIKVQSWFPI